MKAKFIGISSMGFKTGIIYHVKIRTYNSMIYIYDIDSDAWCPYQSMNAVMRNWEFY
jgi:hypothetical protein